ncbi:MAG: hypothetical protein QOG99_3568 [Frankiales bacterium]|jgi:hypothetical protein|nr:hypothetical protein [Frankiales bacterium]
MNPRGRTGPAQVRRPRFGRALFVLAAAGLSVLVPAGSPALASGQGPTTTAVLSGAATVSPCGSFSSVVVSYALTSKNVTGIVISSIPTACNGSSLYLTLTNGTTNAQAGPLTVASGSVTASSLSATVTAASVTGLYIGVLG